jgi:hypothetical protein
LHITVSAFPILLLASSLITDVSPGVTPGVTPGGVTPGVTPSVTPDVTNSFAGLENQDSVSSPEQYEAWMKAYTKEYFR